MNNKQPPQTKLQAFKNRITGISWKWRIIFIIIILVIGGVIAYFFLQPKEKELQYQTATVEKGTLTISITASGSVSAANSLSISTNSTGVVENVYYKNGDYVESGATIATISLDEESKQKQASAYAQYLSSVNQASSAEIEKLSQDASMWSSHKTLLNAQETYDNMKNGDTNPETKEAYTDEEKRIIEAELTQAQKAFSASEQKYINQDKSVAAAQASLTSAWLDYQNYTGTITAPISGTIDNLILVPGTIITSSSSSSSTDSSSQTSSTTIGSIITQGNPQVSVSLTEIDIPKVEYGDKAIITFDALPDKTFTGKIDSIDTTGNVSSGVTSYPVTIILDTGVEKLYPNMTATVTIITDRKSDIVTVSSSAIQTENGTSTVRVFKEGKISTVGVETGLNSDTDVEITSGLNEGDTIVIGTSSSTSQSTSRSNNNGGPPGGGMGGGGIRMMR